MVAVHITLDSSQLGLDINDLLGSCLGVINKVYDQSLCSEIKGLKCVAFVMQGKHLVPGTEEWSERVL